MQDKIKAGVPQIDNPYFEEFLLRCKKITGKRVEKKSDKDPNMIAALFVLNEAPHEWKKFCQEKGIDPKDSLLKVKGN
jgi:hypothetical protein